jgi:hypothetical protein
MIINLRLQSEKAAKQDALFDNTRVGGWASWEECQRARVAALAKLEVIEGGNTAAMRSATRDAAMLSLLTLIPPDRVGVVRKLRFGHSLVRRDGGEWQLDLTKVRDAHKTSRFYGAFCAKLPEELDSILDKYSSILALELGGEYAYLFYPPQAGAMDRPLEPSAWTAAVRRVFGKHMDKAIAPKTLRSIFITWLKVTRKPTPPPPLLSPQPSPSPPLAATPRCHPPSGQYVRGVDPQLGSARSETQRRDARQRTLRC